MLREPVQVAGLVEPKGQVVLLLSADFVARLQSIEGLAGALAESYAPMDLLFDLARASLRSCLVDVRMEQQRRVARTVDQTWSPPDRENRMIQTHAAEMKSVAMTARAPYLPCVQIQNPDRGEGHIDFRPSFPLG